MKLKNSDNSIKRLAIVAIASVLMLALTAICVFCCFFVEIGEEREIIEIPQLVGRRLEDIGVLDKISIERHPVFSDDVSEGEVISQFPYGGARRKVADGEKYTVKLTVSLGKELARVPNLKNYKYIDAAASLRSMGARIKIVSVYDDNAEKDLVLRTIPDVGGEIERGDTVTVFVSRNHIHAPIEVKSYIGLNLEKAAADILAQGLVLGEISYACSEEYAEGAVIAQSIGCGSVVRHGSLIDITVNCGCRENLHPFRGRQTKENGEINGIN